MSESKTKKFTYFIGIDVSRNELDYAVMQGRNLLFHREAKNTEADITAFVAELKTLRNFRIANAVFCMEQTGIYCNHLIVVLNKLKANIVNENPLQIRNSLGLLRGKYDKMDAIRIANYAYTNREKLILWIPRRPLLEQLINLYKLRNRLLSLKNALENPLSEQRTFVNRRVQKDTRKACSRSLAAVESDFTDIESSIEQLIESDEHLGRLKQIITSVPYVGTVTAIQIIISTNEFKDIYDPRKFACYSGVAPFKKESGLVIKKARVSKIANKRMKALLHICAMGSLRGKSELREYYDRKVGEGKPKMAVINALRYKLILRIFACVKQDRCYSKDYSVATK